MDWYIYQENQNLLWNAINRIPLVLSVPIIVRERLFKETIEEYYHFMNKKHDVYNIPFSLDKKKQINRETISMFIEKTNKLSSRSIPFTQHTNTESINKQNINRDIKMVETKQEKSQREFSERQQMYEQMTAKPDIPSPDVFREKEDGDGVIQNMDELIQKYQMEREKDMQFLTPLVPVLSENPLRTKVSFSNTPVIIPSNHIPYKSITILNEDAILPINELIQLEDTRLEDTRLEDTRLEDTRPEDTRLEDTRLEDTFLSEIPEQKILKEISRQIKECLDILTNIKVDENSINEYFIFIEKMNTINNSLEECLRENT